MIVWEKLVDGTIIPLNPQLRLVILDTKLEELNDVICVVERGRHVWGRPAKMSEQAQYKQTRNPGKPYAIGRTNHFKDCARLDRYVSGKAWVPERLAG
jgi:hypothetical protein